jgi:hypothetical protein
MGPQRNAEGTQNRIAKLRPPPTQEVLSQARTASDRAQKNKAEFLLRAESRGGVPGRRSVSRETSARRPFFTPLALLS